MKNICLLLALVFALATPAVVQAQLEFTTNDNAVSVTGYSGTSGALAIPAAVGGLPVTSIGDYAFAYSAALTGVSIPGSVVTIGQGAFAGCTNLVNAEIAGGVTNIGDYAFYDCASLTHVSIPGSVASVGVETFANCAGLTNAIIGDGVGSIGEEAFYGCARLNSMSVPGSVTNLGDQAFSRCASLTSVIFSSGLGAIGYGTFAACASLTNVTISATVTNLGDLAFEGCAKLTVVYFLGNAPAVGSDVFLGDNDATAYYLPGATGWSSSFGGLGAEPLQFIYTTTANAINITGYTGPVGALVIPATLNGLPVISIGASAFAQAESLTSVIIPAGVTNIGEGAFADCTNLLDVYFSGDAIFAAPTAFINDHNATVYYQPGTFGWGPAFDGLPALPWDPSIKYLTNAGAITITGYAGPGGLVTIPGSIYGVPVTSIGNQAFLKNTNLASVTIPASVTNLGHDAFEKCANLTTLTFNGNPPAVGSSVFSGDTNATVFYLPGTAGWSSVFDGLPTQALQFLYSVNFHGVIITGYDGPGGAVTIPATIKSLPVYRIGASAFAQNAGLTSVTIPASVTSVDQEAFGSCTNLLDVYFTGNAVAADPTAFTNDASATLYYSPGATGWGPVFAGLPAAVWNTSIQYATDAGTITVTGYTGPGGVVAIPAAIHGRPVTSIGNRAFTNCATLTSILIPGSVTSIGDYAFESCVELTSVTITNSVTNISQGAFELCSGLTNVTIASGVAGIELQAFYDCTNLVGAYFLGNAPAAGSGVFLANHSVTVYYLPGSHWLVCHFCGGAPAKPLPFTYTATAGAITITGYTGPGGAVNIPASINGLPVTTIGSQAFANLAGLTSVTIPASVTGIGAEAFGSCTNLLDVYFTGNVVSAAPTVFAGDAGATIYYSPGATGWGSVFDGLPAALWNTGIKYSTNAGTVTVIGYSGPGGAVTIPSAIYGLPVTGIGNRAFTNCANLTSVLIPAGVTSLGEGVFENCSSLTNITIPGAVEKIGNYAFEYTGLTSVTIPASATNLGYAAFARCASLTNISVDAQNSFYSSAGGVLFDKPPTTLVQYPAGKGGSYTIPGGVTSVALYAFEGCAGLTSVTCAGSVTNLGQGAFALCTGLTNATITSRVASIGLQAFYGCTNLAEAYFLGNAPAVGAEVFLTDHRVTAYYLPDATGWSAVFAGIPAVLWQPVIQTDGANFGLRHHQFGFNITGPASVTLVVEASTRLGSGAWFPLQSITLTNGSYYFSDLVQAASASRFYRVRVP